MTDPNGLADKAGEFLKSDHAQEALHSEQAEQISDDLLEKGESAVSGVTGGRFDEQLAAARTAVDGAIGTD